MPPLVREQQQTSSLLMDPNAERFKDCTGKVKCVLVGDGAVGKTSLVVSYTTNGYPTEYVPTAFDNYNVIVTVDNQPIRLQLCDTAGQDDFDSLRPLCYPGADVFLLCFSVVSPTSFHNVRDKWLPEIRNHCPHVPIVLVGTQCDLRSDVKVLIELASYREQPVPEVIANRLASLIGAVSYIESSALTQKNLKEVFDTAILVSLQKNEQSRSPPLHAHVSNNHKTRRGGGGGGGGHLLWGKSQLPPPSLNHHYPSSDGRCPLHATLSSTSAYNQSDRKTRKTKSGWKKLCCFS